MLFDNRMHVAKSQPVPFSVVLIAGRYPEKFIEYPRLELSGDTYPLIADSQYNLLILCMHGKLDLRGSVTVLDRIIEQIIDHVGEVDFVAFQGEIRTLEIRLYMRMLFFQVQAHSLDDLHTELLHIQRFGIDKWFPGLKNGHFQHLVDEYGQPAEFVAGDIQVFRGFGLITEGIKIRHRLQGNPDGSDGRFELVRHITDKIVLQNGQSLLFQPRAVDQCEGGAGKHQEHQAKQYLGQYLPEQVGAYFREMRDKRVGVEVFFILTSAVAGHQNTEFTVSHFLGFLAGDNLVIRHQVSFVQPLVEDGLNSVNLGTVFTHLNGEGVVAPQSPKDDPYPFGIIGSQPLVPVIRAGLIRAQKELELANALRIALHAHAIGLAEQHPGYIPFVPETTQ